MPHSRTPDYEVDTRWRIVSTSPAFCQLLRCTSSAIVGRDVRDFFRVDWRPDFKVYVARALTGVGDLEIAVPIVTPCGAEMWMRHRLEPLRSAGRVTGYRASVGPKVEAAPAEPWWQWRPAVPHIVWDFEATKLSPSR